MELSLGAIIAVISFLLGAVLRPYLISYSTKKGENLATHEDIDKLVDQMKAVTKATKKIEAEISAGVWEKQKRWEMKREVLFEAAKRLAEIDNAMLSYSVVLKGDCEKQKAWVSQQPSTAEELAWEQSKSERITRWVDASTAFDESRLFAGIVCANDGKDAFEDLGAFVNNLAAQMTKDPATYDTSRPELIKKILVARNAVRKELEVDGWARCAIL